MALQGFTKGSKAVSITIELPAAVEAALKAEANALGRDVESVAAERLAALFVPEPPLIEEGSPEEATALEAAETAPYHPFNTNALHEKLRAKYGLT